MTDGIEILLVNATEGVSMVEPDGVDDRADQRMLESALLEVQVLQQWH